MTEETKIQLPLWKCHKEVRAAKIELVLDGDAREDKPVLQLAGMGDQVVTREWLAKHKPDAGGYFVRYADGYESYSPAEAFEGGYTLVSG